MDFIDSNFVFYHNTLNNWITSALAFTVIVLLFVLLRKILKRKVTIKNHSLSNATELSACILKQTKIFFILTASVNIASEFLILPMKIERHIDSFFFAILMVQTGFWLSEILSFYLSHKQDRQNTPILHFTNILVRFAIWMGLFISVLANMGFNVTSLVTGLGLGGAAIALASQKIFEDLFASLSIVFDKPFSIGDLIYIDNLKGTVEHVGVKSTRIRSVNGEQIILSNSDILKSRIQNYKRLRERRITQRIGIVYQTSVDKLKTIDQLVEQSVSSQGNTRFDRCSFIEYGDSALIFEMSYLIINETEATYLDITHNVNMALFEIFSKNQIEFAYPTQTIILNNAKQA